MFIKKTLTGHCLSYTCPKCGDALRSPLAEAGTRQPCPQCGVVHTVPGKQEVVEFLHAQQLQKEQKAEQRKRQKAERAERRARSKQEAEFVSPSIDAYDDDDAESDSNGDTVVGRLVKCPDCGHDVSSSVGDYSIEPNCFDASHWRIFRACVPRSPRVGCFALGRLVVHGNLLAAQELLDQFAPLPLGRHAD